MTRPSSPDHIARSLGTHSGRVGLTPRRAKRTLATHLLPWLKEVDRFLEEKSRDSPVGEGWTRRMRWELGRFPQLQHRIDPASPPSSASDVTPDHILALRREMKWEKATFALHFAALRQFLRWADNPTALRKAVWRLPSGQPSHRRWLTKGQLARLLTSAKGREKLLVALEGVNGLRRIEVLRLRRKDVLLDEGCLRVLGKGRDGGKWRKIPMHPIVEGLLPASIPSLTDDERLFGLSSSGADVLLRKAAERAGFPAEGLKVSHHDLRRTFGRLAHQSGMDLIQLKNLYGHTSVEMTVHYIGMDSDQMRQGLNRIELFPTGRALPKPGV